MNLFPPGMLDLGRTVGVRPENIAICAVDAAPEGSLPAMVDLVEPLGSETLYHCVTGNRNVKVTVRVQHGVGTGVPAVPGGRVALVPDMAKAVVFDRP